ncbi:hypothetical protein P4O66_020043, partial [Electrophorus voltai]
MNLDSTPSKFEIMGWDSQTLADYMKKMRLSGCDTVVRRSGMNGSKFLAMSYIDIQKFPKVHVPLITKIINEINQGEKKKGLFHRPKPSQLPMQVGFVHTPETSQRDEFDDEDSEPDYEEPDEPSGNFEDDYICAVSDGLDHEAVNSDCEYELPPSEISTDTLSHCCATRPLNNSHYIDSIRETPGQGRTAALPQRPGFTLAPPAKSQANFLDANSPRPGSHPQRPITPSSKCKPVGSGPNIDRRNKPRSTWFSKTVPEKLVKSFSPATMNLQMATGLPKSPSSTMCSFKINTNGAFLIRDSSTNAIAQPYTLMVLNEHKVYNVQIRFHGNDHGYSLGTGIMGAE